MSFRQIGLKLEVIDSLAIELPPKKKGEHKFPSHAPDPVPATSADNAVVYPSWRPGTYAVDPVPARSV